MNRLHAVLAALREGPGYVSGAAIAARLEISRTAVWKYVKQLEGLGYRLEKVKGKGYQLTETPDRLYPWEIDRRLTTRYMGRNVIYRDRADSTNGIAFKLALDGAPEGTCVVAETQSAGKGRLQRPWVSPYAANLYLSVVLRPKIHPSQVYPVTFLSSLAVYDTVRAYEIDPKLKWPNDVLVGGRKICGTLLELSTEADAVRFVVVGIGLNVNMRENEMTEEIRTKATSLALEAKKVFERAQVCGILLANLERYYDLAKKDGLKAICGLWEEKARIKGTYLEVVQPERVFRGVAEGIDTEGALLLNQEGTITRIIAGDVTF